MNKLIDLLNEFEKEIEQHDWFPIYNWYIDKFNWLMVAEDDQTWEKYKLWEAESILISKRYWFIKWLIDKYHIELPMSLWVVKNYTPEAWYNWYSDKESLLMILSISEDPIKLLLKLID